MTLLEYKNKNNLSYQDIAEILNMKGVNAREAVFKWAHCLRIPKEKNIKIIWEKLNISPNEIYTAYYEKNNK
jgi:lambda repressor-like predicted transcriptional regulator